MQPFTGSKVQDVYDHDGRIRAAIRGFIKYLLSYEQCRQKRNPEPLNAYSLILRGRWKSIKHYP